MVGPIFGWSDILLVGWDLVVTLGVSMIVPRWSWDDEDGPQTRGECRELGLLLNLLPCYHS